MEYSRKRENQDSHANQSPLMQTSCVHQLITALAPFCFVPRLGLIAFLSEMQVHAFDLVRAKIARTYYVRKLEKRKVLVCQGYV